MKKSPVSFLILSVMIGCNDSTSTQTNDPAAICSQNAEALNIGCDSLNDCPKSEIACVQAICVPIDDDPEGWKGHCQFVNLAMSDVPLPKIPGTDQEIGENCKEQQMGCGAPVCNIALSVAGVCTAVHAPNGTKCKIGNDEGSCNKGECSPD